MRYLITGATGFLGRHLLNALAAAHGASSEAPPRHAVLVRDAASWQACPFAGEVPPVDVICGDLSDTARWQHDARLRGIDGIFHLAAMVRHSRYDAEPVYAANVTGTCNMVRVAAHHRCRLVYVSTSGTVGVFNDAQASAGDDAPLCASKVARWPYYHSKALAEQQAAALARTHGVQMVVVRPPMMLGPGDHRFRATAQLVRFLRGRLPFTVAGGIHYIDIRDAATALVAAMQHAAPRSAYNLPGTACTVRAFFNDVAQLSGRRPPIVQLPFKLAWSLAAAGAWSHRRLKAPAVLPDPVVIEMAAHFWGVHSQFAADDLQFVSRPKAHTLRDTLTWICAHRADCAARISAKA
jgi:nucleoside-diphosphate-sugar epimerase